MSYLEQLDKWQAMSHPDLARCQPESLFSNEFPETYKLLHHDIWWRMVRLHGTIHTLEQLSDFPFDHLYARNGMQFWNLVIENFLDTSVFILHGLVNDKGADVHTLRSFKNSVVQADWLDEQMRDLLVKTLVERKFDKKVEAIAKRVHHIRHQVAHPLVDKKTGLRKTAERVSFSDLQRLFDAAHRLFGALSFGSSYVTLAGDLTPGTVGGKPTRSCLDGVLDAVLKDSSVVHEPERMQQWWPETRKHMPEDELNVLNKLRTRIGLQDA